MHSIAKWVRFTIAWRMVVAAAVAGGLSGCGLPTWSELIGQKPVEQPVVAPPVVVHTPQVTAPKVEPPKPPTAEEVIAAFQQTPIFDRSDGSLAALYALQEGVENVTELDLKGSKVTNNGLAGLNKLTGLKEIDVRGTMVDAAGCFQIGLARSLEVLRFDGQKMTDQAMLSLQTLTELKRLEINNSQLSTVGWGVLRAFAKLEYLDIDESNLNDVGMTAVATLKSLKSLRIRRSQVTDAGLAAIAGLPELEIINLTACPINGAPFGRGFKSLKQLSIDSCPIMAVGANGIKTLKNLELLSMAGLARGMNDKDFIGIVRPLDKLVYLRFPTNLELTAGALQGVQGKEFLKDLIFDECRGINDNAFKFLTKCKSLERVSCSSTACTEKGVAFLKQALPDVQVLGAIP